MNLAKCFVSLNHLQASSYYKVMVHSVSAHIMGSHIVYKPFLILKIMLHSVGRCVEMYVKLLSVYPC